MAIGITNQRETTVLMGQKNWKTTFIMQLFGKIEGQAEFCAKLKLNKIKKQLIFNKTGLFIDSYFSGNKN